MRMEFVPGQQPPHLRGYVPAMDRAVDGAGSHEADVRWAAIDERQTILQMRLEIRQRLPIAPRVVTKINRKWFQFLAAFE
jgi:hypothetical protein